MTAQTIPSNFPRSDEDQLLLQWWESKGAAGLLILEVKIGLGGPGDWPDRRRHKRLDGLHLPDADAGIAWANSVGADRLAELCRASPATIVESKYSLNVDVIGQVVAGRDMFSRAYPHHRRISSVVTVWGPPDPALKWVCHRRGIEVFAPPKPHVT